MKFIFCVGFFIPLLFAFPAPENEDKTVILASNQTSNYFRRCVTRYSSSSINGVSEIKERKIVEINENCDEYSKISSKSPNSTELVFTCTHKKCNDKGEGKTIDCKQFESIECL
ncbi:unnamed protein product [Caenorhabditis angaria]|uniref:Uncharacterized protein n=1 Tax=Caenorhabditis angaria TaxID=860376 RepID=A0A9P1NBE1_9PELO|nr:unnamed protein product [Caenorhabditis angaria]